MKDIEIKLENSHITKDSGIKGFVEVNYAGKFDSIVVNAQILGSSELVTYTTCNNKQLPHTVSRLFISKESMMENKAEFTAVINFEPKESHDNKFRVSIIEQHKEIENDQIFATIST